MDEIRKNITIYKKLIWNLKIKLNDLNNSKINELYEEKQMLSNISHQLLSALNNVKNIISDK